MRKTIAIVTAAGMMLLGATAQAKNGDPAGETLQHCGGILNLPKVSGPCVDTKGWGVRVRRADGTWTLNYGPASYKFKRIDGNLFYTFTKDAKPYGKAKFPKDIDY
jgi:hypothetical protein